MSTLAGQVLCIIPGPSHEYAREPDERATRWCFTCRAHVPHKWVLWGDPPARNWQYEEWSWPDLDGYALRTVVPMSYYDPQWSLRCPRGHSDTYFPGCGPL